MSSSSPDVDGSVKGKNVKIKQQFGSFFSLPNPGKKLVHAIRQTVIREIF